MLAQAAALKFLHRPLWENLGAWGGGWDSSGSKLAH